MARKPTLVYEVRYISSILDRFVVENSPLTREEAIAEVSRLLGMTVNNPVLELDGNVINLRNVETIRIAHGTRMDV